MSDFRRHPVLAEVRALLRACELPDADLAESHMADFLAAGAEGELLAVAGFERLGEDSLIRSLAVAPAQRGRGLARALVSAVEAEARAAGVRRLWLLTNTAEEFFAGRGYSLQAREQAPAEITATPEFSSLCPDSAVLMMKTLT